MRRIKGKMIIFVTMSFWDEPHRGRHHYANHLADNNTIIWINRQHSWRDSNKSKKELEHIGRGLYVLHTGRSFLPWRINERLNLDNKLRLRMLLKTLKNYFINYHPDIIWIYDYKALNFVSFFKKDSKCIYFCNDYFGENAYLKYECKLARKVDYVFCTSPKLKDRFEDNNNKCFFIPHGVIPPPKKIKFNKKIYPETVGYIGTFTGVLDIDMFYKIIDQTDFTLILGGPIVECDIDKKNLFIKLFKHKRVKYLNEVKKGDLFYQLGKIDICLLPYLCDFRAKHGFAIKYFAYLFSGKPIVATPYFEWPQPYAEFVNIYNNEENLNEFLCSVYGKWNEKSFDDSISLARQSTWGHRVKQIFQILFDLK
jgi:hypothetical protein